MVLKSLKPEAEDEPPQPNIPAVQITIEADKATLLVSMGNGLFIQQVLVAKTMDDICQLWRESRKELAKQQQLIADVIRTKR